jgi:hypothetical protein
MLLRPRPVPFQGSQGSAQFVHLMHGVSIGFTSAMDAISSPPPHSIFPGGFRTTAPVPAAAQHSGRRPKPIT